MTLKQGVLNQIDVLMKARKPDRIENRAGRIVVIKHVSDELPELDDIEHPIVVVSGELFGVKPGKVSVCWQCITRDDRVMYWLPS